MALSWDPKTTIADKDSTFLCRRAVIKDFLQENELAFSSNVEVYWLVKFYHCRPHPQKTNAKSPLHQGMLHSKQANILKSSLDLRPPIRFLINRFSFKYRQSRLSYDHRSELITALPWTDSTKLSFCHSRLDVLFNGAVLSNKSCCW